MLLRDDSTCVTSGSQRASAASPGPTPVLAAIRERFEREQPLAGHRVSACLHVTTETANLVRTLVAGGADVVLCASNPLSTQDDVAAALVQEFDTSVFAIKGEDNDTYYSHIEAAADHKPHITMDDGADVIGVLHSARREQLGDIVAGTEETTTGVIRLKALEREQARVPGHRGQRRADEAPLRQPLQDGPVHDRRHRARDERPARRKAFRRGRLRLGRSRGRHARRGLGAHVIVTEVDPMQALEALMDGYEVLPMERAAEIGDIFCTATGDKRHHERALRAHEGRRHPREHGSLQRGDRHPRAALARRGDREAHEFVEEYLGDGRRLYLLAEGRLVNSAAEGHPAIVMDMSFANQASSVSGRSRMPAHSSARSTVCRRRSTARSRGSSSRRWASRSMSSPTSRRTTWRAGTREPSGEPMVPPRPLLLRAA